MPPDFSYDNTPPDGIASGFGAPTGGAPTAIASGFAANTGGAPTAIDAASELTDEDSEAIDPGFSSPNDAPVGKDHGFSAPSNTAAVPVGSTESAHITMPASFTPAFTDLTGGGNCLDTLLASAADVNRVLQGTVNGELKSYQVRAGNDATDLPGIVRPANFDADDNAVIFVQL